MKIEDEMRAAAGITLSTERDPVRDAERLAQLRAVRDGGYVPRATLDALDRNGWIAWSPRWPNSTELVCGLTTAGWRELSQLGGRGEVWEIDKAT